MASFLVRTFEYLTAREVAPSRDWFADDGASVHEEAINAARSLRVAMGTSPTTFHPSAPVRRDQTASFLMNLWGALSS